ncbi:MULTISPECIES: aminotransferase class I/II-fold pyridoxal phosphate-dependent enzyme [Brevibacterium]|uniref:DNA-binding transcriptional regulator, MocR family, contains an aminotransferase domain n=2 Tax=Brevibacterium antiquum TaxID=234835 RepID=A0A2H1HRA8_9MICO|nr:MULTISPECIES: aminotransferase class I/II-fold pyridoxal phosphate-dependent enzyme [Brevibacterium]SMX65465.1 DNA-binding transcriptional regulator, MocR family, contains an aminotransferase domain [Brevibacterium antiquum CNRZ 918]SMX66176.1 DNA-binding transcriptional regulator, MocR family, contains an aminotransferase domain [Brevibacterium antiquum]HCG56200.1 aminotransferase [Brevibacterium sp.]
MSHMSELQAELEKASGAYEEFASRGLKLDITRGKPANAQLDLSADLLNAVTGDDVMTPGGVDSRNYGGLDGIVELRELFSPLLKVPSDQLLAGGNASLTLMAQALTFALLHGTVADSRPWGQSPHKLICPVPGYDRHFTLAESLGFELLSIPMDSEGPVVAEAQRLAQDETVKGMWLVPMYSNPTGITITEKRARELAAMPAAAPDFTLLWDNAYGLHHLRDEHPEALDILSICAEAGHPERPWIFASTSKITHAGAGVSFFGAGPETSDWIRANLGKISIGPDKVNQLRHLRFFSDPAGVEEHMRQHAKIIAPKFDAVLNTLERELGGKGLAQWTQPNGGYFITLTTLEDTAERIVKLAAEAGVKLTPAGATHPYGVDPHNNVIRIAPTMPTVEDVELAAQGLVACVKLASYEKLLAG